jgi:hypothetical protein
VGPDQVRAYSEARTQRAGLGVPGGTRPLFTDVTDAAGIAFKHSTPGVEAVNMPQMKGGGALLADLNADGRLDLYFPDYSPRIHEGRGQPARPRLYLNEGDFRFADATRQAGLDFDFMGYGATAADFDRDGDQDLVLTGFGRILLMLNDGQGRFREAGAGLAGRTWMGTAAPLDYDLDGRLDLFVLSFVAWTPEWHDRCAKASLSPAAEPFRPGMPSDGGGQDDFAVVEPGCIPAAAPYLFRGLGDGTFEDVTIKAGLAAKPTRGLGLSIVDLEQDRYPDLIVANDMSPTYVYVNQKDGTFREIGVTSGVAYDPAGNARGGMGIDSDYLFHDDRLCTAIAFFAGEDVPLYCQAVSGGSLQPYRFDDLASAVGLTDLLVPVKFGLLFLDYDSDGWSDFVMVNGHVAKGAGILGQTMLQPANVFQNLAGQRFAEWVLPSEEPLGRPLLARALLRGDLDDDGDLDLVIAQNGGRGLVLRNDTDRAGRHSLLLRLVGTTSNVEGLGTHVFVECAGLGQHRYSTNAPSFMGGSDERLHFGLGDCAGPAQVELRWPSGHVDRYHSVAADRAVRLVEGAQQPETLFEFHGRR